MFLFILLVTYLYQPALNDIRPDKGLFLKSPKGCHKKYQLLNTQPPYGYKKIGL